MNDFMQINTTDPIKVLTAESAKPANVGIVLLHDVFGIDGDLRERMEYWSAMGYHVVAPDLFSREGAPQPLTVDAVDNAARHRQLIDSFDLEKGLQDVKASMLFGRELGWAGVGVLGFGLGGTLAYLAAAQSDCDVAIGYCGIGIEAHLDLASSMKARLSLYFAEEDELVNQDAQAQIREALQPVETARVFVHPYVRHGFARWDSKQRDRCALTLAEHRAGEFFYMNLKLKHWVTPTVVQEQESA